MQIIFYLIHGNSLALGCEVLKIGTSCIICHYNPVYVLNDIRLEYSLVISMYGIMITYFYEVEQSYKNTKLIPCLKRQVRQLKNLVQMARTSTV
jgi:hypothetical protein